MKRRLALVPLLAAAALAFPASSAAHGLVQRANLPIPEWLFGWAAAVVLIVSFVALAVLWPEPRLEKRDSWRPLSGAVGRLVGSRALEVVCAVIGVLLLVLVVLAGYLGVQEAFENFGPTFVFITFWVGLVFVSLLFGDVYRAFNPWRAIGRATGWLVRRVRGSAPVHAAYPERLGRWPAAAGLLAFTWVELASAGLGEQPDTLATLVLLYSAVQFAGMARYGVEPWIANAEAFSVYFNLFSRVGVFEMRDRTLGVRRPLSGLTTLEALPGTVAMVVVMIGTVTFDGLSQGRAWAELAAQLNSFFEGIGFGTEGVERLTNTVGLLLAVGIIAGFYALGIRGARSVGGGHSSDALRRAFVHSLVPIALVYAIAHYLTFFLFEGQQIIALSSDPLGKGWNVFGTSTVGVDYGILSQNGAWYLQVAFVVAGHVAALVLAHERALVSYPDPKLAVRSQYWMLAIMVGFTSLALWLLAQAGTASAVAESKPAAPVVTKRSDRLVDFSMQPPFVNALEIDPTSGDFLLTTNRGFWRIDKDTKAVTKVPATVSARGIKDTVGTFLLIKSTGGKTLIGSGHPDNPDTLSQWIGFMQSDDLGRTWRVVSRLGEADLHKIELVHDKLYAFDAVLSAILISEDGGRTFVENFTPTGLILDFVVDPEDEDYILANNDDQLFATTDQGETWDTLTTAKRMRLSWPGPGALYRADQDGTIYRSPDRGRTWNRVSKVIGEPYKFKETDDPEHLYLALSDGSILETTDGARTWRDVFRPG